MKESFYFHTIRDCTIQFLDVLNDIVINRYTSAGTIQKTIPVCVKFAPKEKIKYYLDSRSGRVPVTLPCISVFINGINYNRDRANDYQYNFQMPGSTTSADEIVTMLNTPAPYDIEFQCTIWTKYQEDLNQILERILTWSGPFVYIAIKEPITNRIVNCKTYQAGVAPEVEMEYGDDDMGPTLKWGITFVCQTWLWKPVTTAGLIHFVYIYNKIIESRALSGSAQLYSTLSLSGISATSAASGASVLYDYEKLDEFP